VQVSKPEVKSNYGNVCYSLFFKEECKKLAIGKCKKLHDSELASEFRRQFFKDKKAEKKKDKASGKEEISALKKQEKAAKKAAKAERKA